MDLPTPPPNNMPKLFAGYKSKMGAPDRTESVVDMLGRYFQMNLTLTLPVLRFGVNTLNMGG